MSCKFNFCNVSFKFHIFNYRNDDGEDEPYEDSENLYFVTECWSEPQCGKITSCPFRLLNGLEYSDVPSKVFTRESNQVKNVNEHLKLATFLLGFRS